MHQKYYNMDLNIFEKNIFRWHKTAVECDL